MRRIPAQAVSVGRSVARRDGFDKVTGAARYIDDLSFPGMLHGATVRSTVPCGEITSVHFAFDTSAFTIVDYRDIPGRNVIAAIEPDQPCLVERVVNHAAEPVLLLAHRDREKLLSAKVVIEYRPGNPVFDPEQSPRTFEQIAIEKGDLAQGFAAADVIVEGEYRVGHQEHVYIEPNGMIAVPSGGGITVYGSLQCPYYVHKALRELLGLRADRVRVVQTETGGGFGGKEEYPSMIAGHAALLALKAQRPVKLVYDRAEDMLATTKRHPGVIRHRTGVTADGRLTALEVDVLLDGGAYTTLSPVVLSRGVLHACGPYRCDHVRVSGRVVMTNTPPNGAFRGFGAPQTQFAMEVQMERVAETLGIDPIRVRERNALRPGDTTATGQKMRRDCSAVRVLREAVTRTDFRRKRRALRGTNRGIGLSLFFHGSGFTGGGEVRLRSKASLELTERGARIRVASAEIGQGSRTTHAQIVADTLGVPFDEVEVVQADTAEVPDSGPTVASRTCMVVGRLLQRCAEEMRRKLNGLSPREYLRTHGALVVEKEYLKPKHVDWNEETYRGDAYGTYGWGCDVAEIELDPDTYEIRPLRMTSVVDVGHAIHPMIVAGQVEGGTAQGIGYALLEEVAMRDGRMANAQLTNYLIPTTMDTPPIDVVLVENPYSYGPYGAKGVGEMPFDGAAPAVVNAVRHMGLDIRRLPATPERIMEAVDARAREAAGARRRAGRGARR
jgi:CO/xanthine dehydrogenase Mo-binding subunit